MLSIKPLAETGIHDSNLRHVVINSNPFPTGDYTAEAIRSSTWIYSKSNIRVWLKFGI